MMKRVGFCGFRPLDVTRKMPFCLGFGGVDANGDRNACDKCNPGNQLESASNQLQRCPRNESFTQKSDKGNILNTLRRKWRRSKRFKCGKRSESLLNMCHSSYPENCESMHASCPKHHHRLKTQKSRSTVSPESNQVLQCQSCEEFNSDKIQSDLAHNNLSGSGEEAADCSCFGSPGPKPRSKTMAKALKLKARASRSLSDISYTPDVSSPSSKTDSESDICQITCNSGSAGNNSYANRLCTDSTENLSAPFNLELSPCHNMGQKFGNLTQELYKLSKYGWYWGPINRSEAESKLTDQPDGAFLVRDSSDDRYILSLSFRSYGKTLHTRIEHSSGLFSFYSQPEPDGGLTSIVELIEQSMCDSQSGVFCYSRSRSPGSPSFPVRLTKPISRFTQVRSLQYLCRFVIRQFTRYDHIQELPLPSRIKGYLEEGHY